MHLGLSHVAFSVSLPIPLMMFKLLLDSGVLWWGHVSCSFPSGSRSLLCVSVRFWAWESDYPSPGPWGLLLLPVSQILCIFSRALRSTRVFCPKRCCIRQWSGQAELVLCLCDTNVLSLASCPNLNLSAELPGNALKRKKRLWMNVLCLGDPRVSVLFCQRLLADRRICYHFSCFLLTHFQNEHMSLSWTVRGEMVPMSYLSSEWLLPFEI